MAEQVEWLAARLRDTAAAHHDAFAHVDGEDPEWPAWYAGYLQGLGVGAALPVEALAALLRDAAAEHEAAADGSPWPEFYARLLADAGVAAPPAP
jgi:hypothetical protein